MSELATEAHAAIATSALAREFNDRVVLRDLELIVPAGSTLVVIGPNGAGKTTLLRMLSGLLRPSRGSLEVLGCELPGKRWKLRGRVGVLGHEPLLYSDLSAAENLSFCAQLHGLGDRGAARIDELLAAVGMSGRATTRLNEMSAGMVQRIALCRALLHEPELLLLDEPLSHLDPGAAAALAPLLGPVPGRTRVVVSHDLGSDLADADLALGLGRGGEAVYLGPPESLDESMIASIYGAGR